MISGNNLTGAIQETELMLVPWFANPIPQMGFWKSRRGRVNQVWVVFIGDAPVVAFVNIDHGATAGKRDYPDGEPVVDMIHDLGG